MLHLSNTFSNLKKAIVRRVVQERVKPEVKHIGLDPFNPKLFPVMGQAFSGTCPTQNESGRSSPASALSPSLFTHDNGSTGTTLTIPPPSPKPPHTPSLWCDFNVTKGRYYGTPDMDGEFKAFLRDAGEDIPDAEETMDAPTRHSAVWATEGPSLDAGEVGIVIPSITPGVEATTIIFYADGAHYHGTIRCLADETGQRDWMYTILVSKVYFGTIHNQDSFDKWLRWSRKRKASEDRVLYVL